MKHLIALCVVLLTGCASPEQYALYLTTQQAIETSKNHADAEKYRALAAIANSGSDAAKVAAVLSMSVNQLPANGNRVAPPQNEALQWASVLMPSLTNIVGFAYGARVSMNASNNAANVAMSTNQAFLGMGQAIQAPQATVTTTKTNTYNSTDNHEMTMNGTGVIGSGTYAPVNITANKTKTTTDSFNKTIDNSFNDPVTSTSTSTSTNTDNSVVNPELPVVAPLQ